MDAWMKGRNGWRDGKKIKGNGGILKGIIWETGKEEREKRKIKWIAKQTNIGKRRWMYR